MEKKTQKHYTKDRGDPMKLKLTYALFLGYTVVHLVFFFRNDGALFETMKLESDLLVLSIFTLMGMIPLGYFIHLRSMYEIDVKGYILIGLSFLFGAFALIPYYFYEHKPKTNAKIDSRFLLLWIVISLFILTFGLFFGSIKTYSELFVKDSFIHIMTLDFCFLVLFTFSRLLKKIY